MKAKAVQKKPASGSKGTNNTDQPEEVKKKQEDLREKTEKWKQGLGEEGLSWALSLLPFVSQIIKIRISHLSASARQSQCKRGLSSVFRKYLLSNIGLCVHSRDQTVNLSNIYSNILKQCIGFLPYSNFFNWHLERIIALLCRRWQSRGWFRWGWEQGQGQGKKIQQAGRCKSNSTAHSADDWGGFKKISPNLASTRPIW